MPSTTVDIHAAEAPANPRSRVIFASLIGTTIEFYDFYVYATAAVLVFPHLFFPTGNETTALLSSFAVFGAAMVARPLGAIFFGHLGDRRGRGFLLAFRQAQGRGEQTEDEQDGKKFSHVDQLRSGRFAARAHQKKRTYVDWTPVCGTLFPEKGYLRQFLYFV